jgi:hypothetical protein
VSQGDLDRLIGEHRLAAQQFDDADIAGFWSKAVTAFGETAVTDLSADSAFQLAYRACLQAAFAVLALKGLRTKGEASHYIAFYAMQKIDGGALSKVAASFDGLRTLRAASVYEPHEDEAALRQQLERARVALAEGLPIVRAWMVKARPELERLLAHLA